MLKTYLSWDIGIINLAYCLIEHNIDTNKFKIIKWGVIDLAKTIIPCSFITKNKKQCNQKAKYICKENNLDIHYCKNHIKHRKKECLDIELCTNEESKCPIEITKKGKNCVCNKNIYGKIDNVYCCKTHYTNRIKQHDKEQKYKTIGNTNANKISINIILSDLINTLDQIPEFLDVNEVLIENQPSLINPTAKTISSAIYTYFMLRGIIDKKTITDVKFISPTNKLKISDKMTNVLDDMKQSKDKKLVYNITKGTGIEFCKELIKDDNKHLQFLNFQHKKDDLCDAFLQGYYYIFCRNGVPQNIQDIMNNIVEKTGGIKNTKKRIKNCDIQNKEKAIDLRELF